MPDWSKLIREQLGPMNLSRQIQEEIVTELAAHLEDIYEEKIAEGATDTDAQEFALKQVIDAGPLASKIERAKNKGGMMNARSKQFWLPALVSLTVSMIWLMAIELTAEKLHLPWRYSNLAFMPYVIWIVTLPLVGALSAHLSYGAGSKRRTCFGAVTFPCMVMFALWLGLVACVLARKAPQAIQLLGVAYGLLFWVVVPTVALLLGTFPLPKSKVST